MKNIASELISQAERYESKAKQLRAAARALGDDPPSKPSSRRGGGRKRVKKARAHHTPTPDALRNMEALVVLKGPTPISTLKREAVRQKITVSHSGAATLVLRLVKAGRVARLGFGVYGPVNGKGAHAQA